MGSEQIVKVSVEEALSKQTELTKQQVDDDEYELIKENILSLSYGDSYYPDLRGYSGPLSLMDSRSSLSRQVCIWFTQEHYLTESQKKLNKELLNILKDLECCCYDPDTGLEIDNIAALEEFLQSNENNQGLKIILNLRRGESGSTTLHAVAGACVNRDQRSRAIDLLLKAGADPNIQNNEGKTPLHYVAAVGDSKGVISLLEKNVNLNICDKQGKTPIQVAIDNHCYSLIGLLLTDKQKKLSEELYSMFTVPLDKNPYGSYKGTNYQKYMDNFTENLREFLGKHKNDPDLKVVLNITGTDDKLKAVERAENIGWYDEAIGTEAMDLLLKAGALDHNPIQAKGYSYTLWDELKSDQQIKLNEFLYEISQAENINKLEEIVDRAIRSGVQLTYHVRFPTENPLEFQWYSLTDYVAVRISELESNPRVASSIICKLISRGAVFGKESSLEVIDTLESEFKDHEANVVKAYTDYVNRAQKLLEAAKDASSGELCDAIVDNTTSKLEYSEDSKVNVAKITNREGSVEYEKTIIQIGKNEVEIEIKDNGTRNYIDLSDNSDMVLTFYTSVGELEVRLRNDTQNKNIIRVEVSDQEKEELEELKKRKETIGSGCLLGKLLVDEAIEQGFFFRSGKFSEAMNQPQKVVKGEIIDDKFPGSKLESTMIQPKAEPSKFLHGLHVEKVFSKIASLLKYC